MKYILSILFFLPLYVLGVCTSGTGTYPSWNATVWSCTTAPAAGPPGCNSSPIYIEGTIQISEEVDYTACPTPIYIYLNGTLDFNTNGVRFRLPAGSGVILGPNGQVIKTFAGGGSSTLISVGGTNVWTAGSGTVTGPAVLGTAPLPIELLRFDAKVCSQKICLEWSTASELNNDFFNIERSTDGFNFQEILTVDGSGTTNTQINYEALDASPEFGANYYRLKQTDFDGASSYSDVITVKLSDSDDFFIEISPNPVINRTIYLSYAGAEQKNIAVSFYSVSGDLIYTQEIGSAGAKQAVILPENFTPGIYLISASNGSTYHSGRLVIQ
jgi:hypothetical protein